MSEDAHRPKPRPKPVAPVADRITDSAQHDRVVWAEELKAGFGRIDLGDGFDKVIIRCDGEKRPAYEINGAERILLDHFDPKHDRVVHFFVDHPSEKTVEITYQSSTKGDFETVVVPEPPKLRENYFVVMDDHNHPKAMFRIAGPVPHEHPFSRMMGNALTGLMLGKKKEEDFALPEIFTAQDFAKEKVFRGPKGGIPLDMQTIKPGSDMEWAARINAKIETGTSRSRVAEEVGVLRIEPHHESHFTLPANLTRRPVELAGKAKPPTLG